MSEAKLQKIFYGKMLDFITAFHFLIVYTKWNLKIVMVPVYQLHSNYLETFKLVRKKRSMPFEMK